MAKPETKANEPRKEGKPGSGKLIGRIVVYGILGILLLLGGLDFRVKRAAEATGRAWRKVQEATPETEDFTRSQLAQYIEGSPTTNLRDARSVDGVPVASVETYSWKGIFREYNIYVGLGLGSDPSVENFIGPGDNDPLAAQ